MPALETVGQYLEEARTLLQDQTPPYRYDDKSLISNLNTGILEARRLRADLFLPAFEVPYVEGEPTKVHEITVPIDPMYRPALVYYICGRAQLRDDEATTDARSGAFLTKFTSQLLTVAS